MYFYLPGVRSIVSKRHPAPDPIEKFELRIVRVFSLVGFIVIVADSAITHIYPYLKHLWHVIFGP